MSSPASRDMTSGSIVRHLFFFSLPIMAGQFLQQCYNLVDGLVVSNFVVPTEPTAFASVNISSSLTFLFLAVALGMSTGTGIMVSQYFGARQYDQLRRTASTSLLFLFLASLVLSALGFLFSRPLLRGLLGVADGPMLDGAVTYLSIYSLGLVFQFLYNVVTSILRALGDSRAMLYFLIVATVMNVAMDLLFVLALGWGIAGTAIATVIAQFFSAGVGLIYMFRRYPLLRFRRGELRIEGPRLRTLIRLSLPATVQQAFLSLSNVALQRVVNSFGQSTIDAFGAVIRIQNFALIPSMGLHTGLVTFVGQNVGAGDLARVKRANWIAHGLAAAICCAVSVLMYLLCGPLLDMFNLSGETLFRAQAQLEFLTFVLWILGALFVSYAVLQGSGDVVPPTIGSATSLLFRVLFAWMLAEWTDLGWQSIYISHPLSTLLGCAVTFGRYFSMKWQTKAVARRSADPAPVEPEPAEG